jgi:hypothetical protein
MLGLFGGTNIGSDVTPVHQFISSSVKVLDIQLKIQSEYL